MRTVDSTGFSSGHTLLLVGVLLSLCFSVGEGVRLLPFPAPAAETQGNDASEFVGGESFSLPGRPPGQLDLPFKIQKRSKKQTDPCEAALRSYQVAHVLPPAFTSERGLADLCSHSPTTLRPGRAPPPLS